jgi:hypothetical protein
MTEYTDLLFTTDEYHNIGPFRFPIFHDLTPGELKAISAIDKASATTQLASMELARKISRQEGISAKEALDVLAQASEPKNEELVYKYLPELAALSEQATDDIEILCQYGTVLMQLRGEVKLPGSDEYIKTPDWTAAQTDKIHRGMLTAMRAFVLWERDGWPTSGEQGGKDTPPTTTPKVKSST